MLRDYWYIACASSRLGSGPRAARVLDQDLVLFRDGDGRPHALLDRCCHRGVKLSLGRISGGHLACAYHGWQYDGMGRCVHVPSLVGDRRIPKGFAVPAFPCVEQDSYVWVWMGEKAPHPTRPAAIPDLDRFGWKQGEAAFKCSAMMVIENQFDLCHPAFVHVDTHPAYFFARALGPRDETFEARVTDDGLIAFAPPTVSAEAPVPDRPFFKISWELPDRVWVRTSLLILLTHIVPTGPNTCRMEWLERRRQGSGITWIDEEHVLTVQDRIMETAQPWYDRCGTDFERSVEVDFVALLARQIATLAESGEWEKRRSQLPQRRIVHYRLAAAV